MATQSIATDGQGTKGKAGVVEVESASRPGLKHFVSTDAEFCSCEAATYGASDCHHRRFVRAQKRMQDGTYHRVALRRGIYGRYFIVVNHEGTQVTGPTTSKLEALVWAAEEDAEAPLASATLSPEVAR